MKKELKDKEDAYSRLQKEFERLQVDIPVANARHQSFIESLQSENTSLQSRLSIMESELQTTAMKMETLERQIKV